jgi:hypothetical protein
MEPRELGERARWSFLAVPSRDGRYTIASGKAGEGSDFEVSLNSLFTCLHTDSTVAVPARGRATTRRVLYIVPGGPEKALDLFRRDFAL